MRDCRLLDSLRPRQVKLSGTIPGKFHSFRLARDANLAVPTGTEYKPYAPPEFV
jgi:hypothetical protein